MTKTARELTAEEWRAYRPRVKPDDDKAVERRERAWSVARAAVSLLREQFGATRVIPFGSVRGDLPWRADSDLDLAVEGVPPELFFRAWSALEQVTPRGLRVDLVDLADASPELRARILGEVDMPDDPLLRLKAIVEDELTSLERVAGHVRGLLAELSDPPRQVELQALASYLHQFYTGVESILERIVDWLQEPKPMGRYWHADLLDQVAEAREGLRPALVDRRLHARLEGYRRFRHFFRHAYGHDLDWRKMQLEVEGLTATLAELRVQLAAFFDALAASREEDDTRKALNESE